MVSSNKNFVLVQIDCDREWEDINISYEILCLFLQIFKDYNLKATFFVVGQDLENIKYRDKLLSLLNDGHEIGNHTYSHFANFKLFDYKIKENEIDKCEKAIVNKLNYFPKGFRTPYFGLDFEIIEILEKRNYLYDSSILPSGLFNIINSTKNIINNNKIQSNIKTKSFTFEKKNHRYSNLIEEIPVSVFPLIKFPCHASYAMTLPKNLSYRITKAFINSKLKTNSILTYVFHLNDLCENRYLRSKEFKLFPELYKRLNFVNWVCKEISDSFNSITTQEYVNIIRNRKNNEELIFS